MRVHFNTNELISKSSRSFHVPHSSGFSTGLLCKMPFRPEAARTGGAIRFTSLSEEEHWFTLQCTEELPQLVEFLEMDPFMVPDWLAPVPPPH